MAFDLIGLKPESDDGYDFRERGGNWVPLWEYVSNLVPSLTEEQVLHGRYNDGITVSKQQADVIADLIETHLESGQLAEHATEFNQRMSRMFPSETCQKCDGTGIGTPPLAVPPDGTCIFCRGTGTKISTRPEFSMETAKYFAAFCRSSGGFEIH
jgi:hypothetical protein